MVYASESHSGEVPASEAKHRHINCGYDLHSGSATPIHSLAGSYNGPSAAMAAAAAAQFYRKSPVSSTGSQDRTKDAANAAVASAGPGATASVQNGSALNSPASSARSGIDLSSSSSAAGSRHGSRLNSRGGDVEQGGVQRGATTDLSSTLSAAATSTAFKRGASADLSSKSSAHASRHASRLGNLGIKPGPLQKVGSTNSSTTGYPVVLVPASRRASEEMSTVEDFAPIAGGEEAVTIWSFASLLQALGSAHDSEVNALRSENATIRAEAERSGIKVSLPKPRDERSALSSAVSSQRPSISIARSARSSISADTTQAWAEDPDRRIKRVFSDPSPSISLQNCREAACGWLALELPPMPERRASSTSRFSGDPRGAFAHRTTDSSLDSAESRGTTPASPATGTQLVQGSGTAVNTAHATPQSLGSGKTLELPGLRSQETAWSLRSDTSSSLLNDPNRVQWRNPNRLVSKRLNAVGHFDMRHAWKSDSKVSSQKGATNTDGGLALQRQPSMSAKTAMRQTTTKEELLVSDSVLQRFVLHPGSWQRLGWDLASMALLVYDIVMIPFTGVFDPHEDAFMIFMTYLTLIFWTLDLFCSMLTGFQRGNKMILRPSAIALHYIKTWFSLDLLILVMDWFFAVGGDNSLIRLGRSLRTMRFIRTLRLVRLVKMRRIMNAIQDMINTESTSACFSIAKIVFLLVLANHIVACCWYGLSALQDDDTPTWVRESGADSRSMMYAYTTSLHWSLTQFTPASMEIHPYNVSERIFAVCVLLFAMLTFSFFVSLLTAALTDLKKIHSDESRQFWLLRRYLRDWSVSRRTAVRVQRYLEYAYQRQMQRVQERHVELLALLSEPLRVELTCEVFSRHISAHPLFGVSSGIATCVSRSLRATALARGDSAFACGEESTEVVFVAAGELDYTLGDVVLGGIAQPDQATAPGSKTFYVLESDWVGEPVLWTAWQHLGDLVATSNSHTVLMDAERFSKVISANRPIWASIRRYAQEFLVKLNEVRSEDLTDQTQHLFSIQEIVDNIDFSFSRGMSEKDSDGDAFELPIARLRRQVTRKLMTKPWGKRQGTTPAEKTWKMASVSPSSG